MPVLRKSCARSQQAGPGGVPAAAELRARRALTRGGSLRATWLASLLFLAAIFTAGCASDGGYLTSRRAPRNPLDASLNLMSRKGPRPTARTEQLLRRYDLMRVQQTDSASVLAKLEAEIAAEPTAEKVYACAELAYIRGKQSEAAGDEQTALEHYGASVAHAYMFLFDPRYDRLRNPYDPQFRSACDLYNGALEATLRIANRQKMLRPGATYSMTVGGRRYNVGITVHGRWQSEEIERFEFVSDYEIEGLNNRYHTYGLGVPLIAVRRTGHREQAVERFYPPGLSFPITAFLRVVGDQPGGAARHCSLDLFDSSVANHTAIGGRLIPLETDLTTPLAYFLDHPALQETRRSATTGLLNPNRAQALTGLYMLEPYDPNKIPVLMVHGLWSNPLTWMDIFNDLRSFPEIRDRYQFWFYLYPTGQPFWISAAQLRDDLARARRLLDPEHETAALDQMVLVGHSMGGLVSRLQTIDSRDDFWSLVSHRPLSELKATPQDRTELARTLYFRANPSIRCVITIGTPHRGSQFANQYTRWLGRKLITLPDFVGRLTNRVTRENPGFFDDTQLLTTTTSIDSLAPDSPILPAILNAPRPPWVKLHNIVGLVPKEGIVGRLSAGSDGIVSYESAHLENADSETIVEADHLTVHQQPRSVLTVRNILRQHLEQVTAEAASRQGPTRASFTDDSPPPPEDLEQEWTDSDGDAAPVPPLPQLLLPVGTPPLGGTHE